MTHGRSWFKLTGVPVSQANQLLSVLYQVYRGVGAINSTILHIVGYGLPAVLHAHVKTVMPMTVFASIHTPSVGEAAASANLKVGPRKPTTIKDEMMPTCLRWLYNCHDTTDRGLTRLESFLD